MQKTESYWDGHKLYIQGKVIPDKETVKTYYFLVRSDQGRHFYFVSVNKDDNEWNCCCEHGSQWRWNKDIKERTCKHAWAALHYLKNERGVSFPNAKEEPN